MTAFCEPIQLAAQRALQTRAVVAALGEVVDPSWWGTEFMTEAGMRFLERLYPRTVLKAAVNAAGKAACDAHDRVTGRVGVYHLFRLPEALEAEIYRLQPPADDQFEASFRAALVQPAALLELLDSLRDTVGVGAEAVGALKIDVNADRVDSKDIAAIASLYYVAFSGGKQVFPYFLSSELG